MFIETEADFEAGREMVLNYLSNTELHTPGGLQVIEQLTTQLELYMIRNGLVVVH